MAYDPSTLSPARQANQPPRPPALSSNISPALAIAEAWKKESRDNQEKWRTEDAKLRVHFTQSRPDSGKKKAKM
ncbi:hypothetical protein EVG20_g1371 [Dentipellis fragilis]|uniref:HMG box domain-containing protein n=1 Tax=Dentipellis fragilis TaxID=205917 RepID=A0A4Y9ZAZ6_9AGAM|nr:hypothetical protein EVG20_g1371 [Dentipellis fragilis]